MATRINGTNRADSIRQGNTGDVDIFGLGGNDEIVLNLSGDRGGNNFVDAGTGNDIVVNNFEGGNTILLGDGDDVYAGQGFAFSGSAADIVRAGNGNDIIAVTTFHSTYFGDAGNDKFISEGWQNAFNGGAGRDTISYELRDESNTLGGSGVSIDLGQGFAQTGATRSETLISIENAIGTAVGDTILGSGVANTLNGAGGNDLLGGQGGNDILIGGMGSDDLHGGFGADIFDFNSRLETSANANRDVILDFTRSEGDKIDLRTIDADLATTGNQAFTFIGAAAFTRDAGELRVAGGIVSGDMNGDGRADFQIAVEGFNTMLASDFLL